VSPQPAELEIQIDTLSEHDIYRNLAVEDHFFQTLDPHMCRLLFWASHRSIVIGKNQNPWRECDLARLATDGIAIARRMTGGGTVYHDRGNLNFSFILDRRKNDPERQLGVVVKALATLDIDARIGPQHVLLVGDKKVSGNAFYYRHNSALHHGTLLIDAELERLRRYLRPTLSGVTTRGVASNPASTTNLCAIRPGLTRDNVEQALSATFALEYGHDGTYSVGDGSSCPAAAIESGVAKFANDEWLFDMTPPFTISQRTQFNDVEIDATLSIKKAKIVAAEFAHPDATWTEDISSALRGCAFRKHPIQQRLAIKIADSVNPCRQHLAQWLAELPGI
jgi:lipoate-protein ligase A